MNTLYFCNDCHTARQQGKVGCLSHLELLALTEDGVRRVPVTEGYQGVLNLSLIVWGLLLGALLTWTFMGK